MTATETDLADGPEQETPGTIEEQRSGRIEEAVPLTPTEASGWKAPGQYKPVSHVKRPWVAVVVMVITGLAALAPTVFGFRHHRAVLDFELELVPGPDARALAGAFGVIFGVVLLYLSVQIYKLKRRAWRAGIVLYGLGIAISFVQLRPLALGLSIIGLISLIVTRERFTAEPDAPSLTRLLIWAPIYVIFVYVVGGLMLFFERARIMPQLTPWAWIRSVSLRVVGLDDDLVYANSTFDGIYGAVMLGLGALGLVLFLFFLFRPIFKRPDHSDQDWEHARRLVHAYGWDTLAYFVFRPDKAFFFSSDGEAMLAYGYRAGWALVSGDPVGRPESIPVLLNEFIAMCNKNAWRYGFLAVREADMALYRKLGLRSLYMGDEAIIHTQEFDLDGRDMRKVRQSVSRFEKAGYTYEFVVEADCDRNTMLRLNQISANWRGEKAEEGFTTALSQEITGNCPECGIAIARDKDGVPMGFMHLVPCFGDKAGYSLDIMRYERSAPNGMMEFLISQTALELKARDVPRLSTNFAAFGRLLEDDIDFQGTEKIARWGVKKISTVYQADNLRKFNAKFKPHWLPRVIVYKEPQDIARIGILYLGAERFLRLPFLGMVLAPKAKDKAAPEPSEIEVPAGLRREPAQRRRRGQQIAPPTPDELGETPMFQARLKEVSRMRENAYEPWPILTDFAPNGTAAELRETYGDLAPDTETDDTESVAGRVMALREYGPFTFCDVRDRTGVIQLYVRRDAVGDADWDRFKEVGVGDFVGATGTMMTTKTGELSVKPTRILLTSKALRPLPDKATGFRDPGMRARRRYVDLIMNDDARDRAVARSKTIAAIRTFMNDRDFIEVETSMLQNIPGGANAKPFITHHNALDIDMYLRIATELQLKRLIVGGLERVYEIGRNFRNEGIDNRHNPEFTAMEAYCTYMDYLSMMEFTEELVAHVAREVTGGTKVTVGDREMDFTTPWERLSMIEAVEKTTGLEVRLEMGVEEVRRRVEATGFETEPFWGAGKIVESFYDEHVQNDLWGPLFLYNYPSETSPLAKRYRENPLYAERFEVITAAREMVNAYTEQNDPIVQREALMEQMKAREQGDDEAERIDFDFLRAIEHAMPPLGGMGIGIDRLIMLLTNTDQIRDVILFPTFRPAHSGAT